jgi:hypothetical protein
VLPDVVPAPWDLDFLFDVPFVYLGMKDLLYEVTVWSVSMISNGYYMDAANVAVRRPRCSAGSRASTRAARPPTGS